MDLKRTANESQRWLVCPYDRVAADLAPLVGNFDSPLQKVGSTWRVKSPMDAWMLLASRLTSGDVSKFESVALRY